jgi:hypothetical protein
MHFPRAAARANCGKRSPCKRRHDQVCRSIRGTAVEEERRNDRFLLQRMTAQGTLQNLAKVGFTAGGILCLHFPAVGSQLDSLNQPGVHHGKLI